MFSRVCTTALAAVSMMAGLALAVPEGALAAPTIGAGSTLRGWEQTNGVSEVVYRHRRHYRRNDAAGAAFAGAALGIIGGIAASNNYDDCGWNCGYGGGYGGYGGGYGGHHGWRGHRGGFGGHAMGGGMRRGGGFGHGGGGHGGGHGGGGHRR